MRCGILAMGIAGALCSGPVIAQEGSIVAEQRVTPTTAKIGDHLTYQLTVTYNADVVIKDIGGSGISDPFSVISFKKSRETVGDKVVFRFVASISPFATGSFPIPERTIKYSQAGVVHAVSAPEVVVEVDSVLAPTGNHLEGIKPATGITAPISAIIACVVAVTAVIGFIAFHWLTRRNGDIELEIGPECDDRTPEQRAIDALDDLSGPHGENVAFYTQLSLIIRRYLADRFSWGAEEMTTLELRGKIDSACDAAIAGRLIRVLELCDLVKFAKFIPADQDAATAVEKIRQVIIALTPTPEDSRDDIR